MSHTTPPAVAEEGVAAQTADTPQEAQPYREIGDRPAAQTGVAGRKIQAASLTITYLAAYTTSAKRAGEA